MPNEKHGVYSYDEVPYHSWPYPQSHPDRLATIATLFGMEPQPVDQARVLELGCAGGGNLIPMAETFSESHFVGVDLSARELADARSIVAQLGLKNIDLRHADVARVGPELGKFHYIIAHGVFSWVAREVQERIFQICHDNLEPNGVAYVSYNTYPGWRMRGMIRDMVCYHTAQFGESSERVSQARALLSFLADSAGREQNAYGTYLQEELQLFGKVEDHYLYHEHLEEINEPTYFYEFVNRAEAHGLQYLGEAQFSEMMPDRFAGDVESTLQRITRNIIQMEQYMDFLRNRTFRQTLLCHKSHELERTLKPPCVQSLYVASRLSPESPDADYRSSEPLQFHGSDIHLNTADPLAKTSLLCLRQSWPQSLSFQALLGSARSRLDSEPVQEAARIAEDTFRLGEHILQCYAGGALELHAGTSQFASQVSGRPLVSPLVRLQAQARSAVTSRKHDSVQLNDIGRHIVQCLDGNHDRQALMGRLLELVEQEVLVVQADGQPVTDQARREAILEESLEKTLKELADCALLVG